MFSDIPPHFLIPILGIIMGTTMTTILLYLLVRSWTRRLDRDNMPRPMEATPDITARLARIEAAVESIAIEVERISESQRFLTKIQAERLPSGQPASPESRQR